MKFTTMVLDLTAVKKLKTSHMTIQTHSNLFNPREKVYLIELDIYSRTSLVKLVDVVGV